MGKYSPEGVFYLHLTIISFSIIVFTVLKNFNFENYDASSVLTGTQVNFLLLFFIIGFIGVLLFLIRGYTIKTPKFYTRAGVALVLIVIGLVIITGMIFHDQLLGNSQQIGPLEMLGILFGSFLTVVGSFIYISIKFPDEAIMKHFKQAVRDEIRQRAIEEQQWNAWQLTQKRAEKQKPKKTKHVQVKDKKKLEKRPKSVPSTPTQVAVMEPVDELTIVNCAKCARQLKVSTPERPVTIKCPYCEAIGVIKE
jgi:hypothetical protein